MRGCSALLIDKRNQIYTKKLLEREKEIVREVAQGEKHYLRNLQIAKHKNQSDENVN